MTDPSFDVVVVGFGAAGASAAIEAAEAGCSVLVLERFYGGGATALSGGVVYAGGGTPQQKAAGIEDTPENMLAYLRREVGDAVSEETLHDFAYGSTGMIDWLEHRGAVFEGSLCPYKTSYPTNRHYLYYSGNEQVHTEVAAPAPRGHRFRAKNFSGQALFDVLREAALRAGVQVQPLATARRLIVSDGAVVGVEYTAPCPGGAPRRWHRALTTAAVKMQNWYPPIGRVLHRLAAATSPPVRTYRARADRGVVLSGGGYAHNKTLLRRYAPQYLGLSALGTIGDDGAVIELGARVGGALGHMSNASGWRFISPPSAFARGVLVGGNGDRIGNEQLYGATLSEPLVREHGATAWLILGTDTWRDARGQIREQSAFFNLPQLLYWFSPAGHVVAQDIDTLADAIGVDHSALEATLTGYDSSITAGEPDRYGKKDGLRTPLLGGPLRAINCSAGTSAVVPFPFMTLGGLVVDERTGAVLGEDRAPVPGVYAAGRSAVGLCSTSYLSGLSIADAIYSGRRAGRTLATTPALGNDHRSPRRTS